jgi:Ni,Fe-hydrogenase III large subunit/Ni,Fe-hydrogenase III component G
MVDARSLREALALRLGRRVSVSGPADELSLDVSGEELGAAVEAVAARGGRHATLVGLDLRAGRRAGGFAVEEVMSIAGGPVVRLRAALPASAASAPTYPSLTPALAATQWDEREIYDLYGIVPAGHPDPRPLVHHQPDPDSGRRFKPFVAHGDGVYQLPVGPIHAGIIEPGHFRFSAVGESVLHLDARLFYTHRGIERLVEGRSLAAALPILERACGVCTVTHATAFSQAVERLTGTEIPAAAATARVLLAELERLYNHVGDLGNMCAGVGVNFGTSRLGWEKERLVRLNESLTGHRYLTGSVVPGGLRRPLNGEALAGLADAVKAIDHEVRSIVRLLVRSDGFMARLHGTGVLHAAEARRLGAVGVAARASGLADDLRLDRPVGGYRDLNVEASGASTGDAAARFHVRAMEIGVSAGIVRELATRLAGGGEPCRVPLARDPKPGDSTVVGAEGPRGASWLWLMAGPDGSVARLHLRSGSFANWPVVASVVPGNLVPDFPIINKSFELCYACTDR